MSLRVWHLNALVLLTVQEVACDGGDGDGGGGDGIGEAKVRGGDGDGGGGDGAEKVLGEPGQSPGRHFQLDALQ